MPNTRNFQSSTDTRYGSRYTISRVVADYQDNLLSMEAPAQFSPKNLQNNVEVHLYSLADNSLIFSFVVKNENSAIYVQRLQYNDGTFRNLLFIDFAKIQIPVEIPPGRFSATLNFFVNEIGAYDDRVLKVSRISTSRSEIELQLTDTRLLNNLDEFALPRINTEYVVTALKQIFNQEDADTLIAPMSPAKIDSASLYQNFESGSGQKLIEYNFDDDNESQIGINTITQNVLNVAYPIAYQQIAVAMGLGSASFTETELSTIVVNAIDEAYDSALLDEEKNPQNYRFDLI